MRTIKFRFTIDDDVKQYYSISNSTLIHLQVTAYLNDPEGWGIFFEPVMHGESVHIRLCMPHVIKEKCGFDNLSCAELGGRYVFLSAKRWFHGAAASKLPLSEYRQYLVSHEIGHILGHDHKQCPCKGCKAPIMMQQTRGIGDCIPNTKVQR
jgi:hypothetical protein